MKRAMVLWIFAVLMVAHLSFAANDSLDIDVEADISIDDFADPGFEEIEKELSMPPEDVEPVGTKVSPFPMPPRMGCSLALIKENKIEDFARICMKERRCDVIEKAIEMEKERGRKEIVEKLIELSSECRNRVFPARPVVEVFRERMEEIRESDASPDEKIRMLRELRRQIDEEIKRLLRERRRVRYDEIAPVARKIRIEKGVVVVGNTSVRANATIELNGTAVKVNGSKVFLDDVEAPEVEIEDGVVKIEGKVVRVLPKKLKELGIRRARLKVEKGKPVYESEKEEEKRLLLIIPMRVREIVKVDAETGKVEIKKPWWAFLAR